MGNSYVDRPTTPGRTHLHYVVLRRYPFITTDNGCCCQTRVTLARQFRVTESCIHSQYEKRTCPMNVKYWGFFRKINQSKRRAKPWAKREYCWRTNSSTWNRYSWPVRFLSVRRVRMNTVLCCHNCMLVCHNPLRLSFPFIIYLASLLHKNVAPNFLLDLESKL
jgi:hypothetical protein